MGKTEEFYAIANINNLEWLDREGYTGCFENAKKIETFSEAKDELLELDEPNGFQIYKITQKMVITFEHIEEEE